jgi:hypothetical protein
MKDIEEAKQWLQKNYPEACDDCAEELDEIAESYLKFWEWMKEHTTVEPTIPVRETKLSAEEYFHERFPDAGDKHSAFSKKFDFYDMTDFAEQFAEKHSKESVIPVREVEPKEGDYIVTFLNHVGNRGEIGKVTFTTEVDVTVHFKNYVHVIPRNWVKGLATQQEVAAYIEEKHRLEVEALVEKWEKWIQFYTGKTKEHELLARGSAKVLDDLKELINPNQKD